MGTDIHGAVECRSWQPGLDWDETVWRAAVDLDLLGVERDYDAFDCLFGMRSLGRWEPIAAGRGFPDDAADATVQAKALWQDLAVGATWIRWDEVEVIDWDEPALQPDIAQYLILHDGSLERTFRSVWSRGFARAAGIDLAAVDPMRLGEVWQDGTEWRTARKVYRVERIRRRGAVPPNGPWRPVWSVMEALAEVHGVRNVRLVVWFDE